MAKPELDPTVTKANRVERAREFYDFATQPLDAPITRADRQQAWGQLWLIKKQAKYGWDRLGFNPQETDRIKTNKPDWV
jgi:hypothetical protein